MSIAPEDGRVAHAHLGEAVLAEMQGALPAHVVGELTLDTPLGALGVDSVALMEALNRIEEAFGVRFNEEAFFDLETGRDVVEYIAAHRAATATHSAPLGAVPNPPALPVIRVQGERSREPARPEDQPPGPVPPEQSDVALFPECVAFHARLAEAAAAGLENPFFRLNEQVGRPTAVVNGRAVISYTSFDYLGLGGHPAVKAAAQEAIERFGTSASASRLVGGDSTVLQQLDHAIAHFLGAEAALVFPSGYGTNASLFGHLFGEGDLILYDELAHNSIVQGASLARAARRPFPHNDAAFVDRLLADVRGRYRRVVVAIEGVYSMDGDYPDLPHFLAVKRRHGALLFVDEAHSLGVLGPTGRGIAEHFGVAVAEGDLWMGTISKALASGGGYLAGREPLIRYLKYTTPAFVFATACSPANAAAALAALAVIRAEPQRVARLRARAALFLKLARDAGLNTGNSHDTPIVPVIIGDSRRAMTLSAELFRQGIDAQPILYPAVRESAARLRFFITAEHTEPQLVATVAALARLMA